MITIRLKCSVCTKTEDLEVPDPGWSSPNDGMVIPVNGLLCEDHRDIEPFILHQCAACISSWGDDGCELYQRYALRINNLSDSDLDEIRNGVCPFRGCGLYYYEEGEGRLLPIKASAQHKEAGRLLVDAIIKSTDSVEEK